MITNKEINTKVQPRRSVLQEVIQRKFCLEINAEGMTVDRYTVRCWCYEQKEPDRLLYSSLEEMSCWKNQIFKEASDSSGVELRNSRFRMMMTTTTMSHFFALKQFGLSSGSKTVYWVIIFYTGHFVTVHADEILLFSQTV